MSHFSPGWIRRIGIRVGLAFLLAGWIGWGADEADFGPGRLSTLIGQADWIVVAEFVREEVIEESAGRRLHFTVVRGLKGAPIPESLFLTTMTKRLQYAGLVGANRVLLFLKAGGADPVQLVNKGSYLRLEGNEAGLDEEVARYLAIQASPDRYALMREFIFEGLANSRSDFLRENLAEDLWDRVENRDNPEIDPQEAQILARAVLANPTKSRLTEPLCLVMDAVNAPQVNECCLTALLNPGDQPSYRAAAVLAKRKDLLNQLVTKLQTEKDPVRMDRIIRQLYQVPESDLLPSLRKLWERNPVARPMIVNQLNGLTNTPAKEAFLRDMNLK